MAGMETPETNRPWFLPTPAWLVYGSIIVTGVLFLSERFRWFPFNAHKGWTVLIAVAGVGVVMLAMLVRLAVALLLRSLLPQGPYEVSRRGRFCVWLGFIVVEAALLTAERLGYLGVTDVGRWIILATSAMAVLAILSMHLWLPGLANPFAAVPGL